MCVKIGVTLLKTKRETATSRAVEITVAYFSNLSVLQDNSSMIMSPRGALKKCLLCTGRKLSLPSFNLALSSRPKKEELRHARKKTAD